MINNYSMIFLVAAVALISCTKDRTIPVATDPPAEMIYKDLHEKEIRFAQPAYVIDLDEDKTSDLIFSVWLIGDPVLQQDKRQFRVSSGIHTNLAVNAAEQVPALSKDDNIPLSNFNGYSWYKVSSVILVQRIEDVNGNISWDGTWKGTTKKYLPFQLLKNRQRFNGWLELSVDIANEKLLLHRIAISKNAEKEIKAG
jgi:hypothetical protein